MTEVKKVYLREVAVGTDNDFPFDKSRSSGVDRSHRITLDPDIDRHNSYHGRSNANENATSSIITNRRNHNYNKASLCRMNLSNAQHAATNNDMKNYAKEQRMTECVKTTYNEIEKFANNQGEIDNEENDYTPVPVKQLIQEFEKTCRPVLQYKQISPKVIPIVQQSPHDNDIARFFETRNCVKYSAVEDHRR